MTTRADKADLAFSLRARGLTLVECAKEMGFSTSYVRQLLYDPSGEKERARKRSYAGVCADCGGPTSGSAGGSKAKRPMRCAHCASGHRRPATPKVVTVPRASGPRRCSCGTYLNRYNTGTECGPCVKAAADARLAAGIVPEGPPPHRDVITAEERRERVMNALEMASPLTTRQVTVATGMSWESVMDNLRELRRDGLVEEAERHTREHLWQLATDYEALMGQDAA